MTKCNSTNPDVSKYTDFDTALESLPLDSEGQKGGSVGYNLRVENPTIGGLAEVKGYNNQPELMEGQFVEGTDACDSGQMTGGKRRRSRKSKRNRNKKSKRNTKSRRNINKKSKRNNKSKRNINKKSKRNTKSRKRRNLKGGMAPLNDAFSGSESIYTPKMEFRSFDCKQPVWEPKCT